MTIETILAGKRKINKVYTIALSEILYSDLFIPADWMPSFDADCFCLDNNYYHHNHEDLIVDRWSDIIESCRYDDRFELFISELKTNGFVKPVTVKINNDRKQFVFIDGHQRIAAAKTLDISLVPVYIGGITTEPQDLVALDSNYWPDVRFYYE